MTVGPDVGVDPCRDLLRRQLRSAEVENGMAAGMWRVVELAWPVLYVSVAVGESGELGLRLALDGYPVQAPAGQPWDLTRACLLTVEQWPTSGRSPEVFRPDWSPHNGYGPYLACDRAGLTTHPDWASTYPDRAWHRTRSIGFYLQQMHRELEFATLPPPGGAG